MSKEQAILDGIIMELHEIKCHIANERPFEAGVGLGGLMNAICNKLEKFEDKDEEVQSEESDEECEEGSEEEDFDWEAAHDVVETENCELRKNIKDANSQINLVKTIIKDLIKQDHIFPGKIEQVIKKLALCPGETEDDLYALQSGRTIRMKE